MITGTSALSLSAHRLGVVKRFGDDQRHLRGLPVPVLGRRGRRGARVVRVGARAGGSSLKISSNSEPDRRLGDSRRTLGRSE